MTTAKKLSDHDSDGFLPFLEPAPQPPPESDRFSYHSAPVSCPVGLAFDWDVPPARRLPFEPERFHALH